MESHVMARSLKGHAATSGVDKWVAIQENTFRNWVNEQLRIMDMEVNNLEEDFDDGVRLCGLLESLQGKRVRVIKKPKNHHQQLANVAEALTAIANDNIRLVNIGPEDIVNGNLKLILGLIWHLILRYQIGKSKFPTKKLMLAWLQAVIPDCNIQNFTSDWNDGVALHALIDWCKPGLCPDWRHLSRSDRLNNCRDAMTLAKTHFDIPLVVRPEDLSSADLDELSGMTYLSYFMKLDSPGYHQTLNLVRKLLRQGTVNDFTSDWNDGRLLCNLVQSVGGHVSGWPTLTGDPVENMQRGLDAAENLSPKGIHPILSAKEMCDPEVDHIGIMAYAAYFTTYKPVRSAEEKVIFSSLPQNVSRNQEASFSINLEDDDVSAGDIRAEVIGPDSNHNVHFNWVGRRGEGYFTPTETGLHKLNVYCENQMINGCPASFKVLADRSKVSLTRVERCTVGHLTELQVNSSEAGQGEVRVEARAPSGRSINLTPVPRHGNYVTNFNPTEVGEWEISVLYDDDHIYGSPYQIKVYDPSQVKIFGLEGGTVGTGLTFNADATRAGSGDLKVKVLHNGMEVPSHMYLETNGLYKVDFTPEGSGSYNVYVSFNDEEVRGSPYTVDIVDSSNVTVSGDGLSLVRVNKTAVFEINTGSTSGKVECEITSPSGGRVPCHVNKLSNGSHTVQYIPQVAGDHKVTVRYGGHKVKGSPFLSHAFDETKVIVSEMPLTGFIDRPVTFEIDASKAGRGNIEIMVDDGSITCEVQNHGNNRFTASYKPTTVEEHLVKMNFNGIPVNGSPWKVRIVDPQKSSATGPGLDYIHVHRLTWFDVHTVSKPVGIDDLRVIIRAPNGQSIPCNVVQESSGYRVEYSPSEVGDHRIEVKYADRELAESPFTARAYDTSAIKVTPLSDAVVGQPVHFTIDVRKAGEGQLEIMVNNGNLPNTVESEETGVYQISFVPETAGTQTVDITFNKENHPGSPLVCNAVDLRSATVRSLDLHPPVDRVSTFYIHSEAISQGIDANVDVYSPNKDRVHADLIEEGNGQYRVEWTPRMAGPHQVDIHVAGSQIEGSPFSVDVFDLSSIRIDNFRHGIVGEDAGFSVDFSSAGTLEQDIKIINPSGQAVVYDSRELGYMWRDYIYEPEEPGNYKIYISYGGFEVPGCPFTQTVEDGGMPTASGGGLYFAEEDKPAVFTVDVGRRKGDLGVQVQGPNSMAKYSIDQQADGTFMVTYIPVEVGLFDINVAWNGNEIAGSPYRPKVVDSRKVRIIGGWQHFMDSNEVLQLAVGERKQLPFDISEAGPGTLRAEVSGPSGAIDADIDTYTHGKNVVEFTPQEEGNHYIHIFWSDLPLMNSPFLGYAVPQHVDASKIILTGRGLREAVVREESEFMIDGSQAGQGAPEVTLTGIKAEVGVRIVAVGNGRFKCSYVPVVPGAYLLHINWNGRQLRGSPYKVNVIGAFYPNKVVVSGEGIHGGILGREIDVRIDTRKAGPGELTAYCMGPRQVGVCELTDNHDGTFRLGIRPKEAGRHVLQIKYGGEHVQGSPFVFKVTAQPDASKVRVVGPGVEHGILATFVSRFIVETKGAGAGQLTVRIRGPKGGFQVEMYRDSQRDRTILCRYDPTECGLYIISVKWSGVDVPGSPFHVHILDTQEELEQVLNEVSYSIKTGGSHGSFQQSQVKPQRLPYAQWREAI